MVRVFVTVSQHGRGEHSGRAPTASATEPAAGGGRRRRVAGTRRAVVGIRGRMDGADAFPASHEAHQRLATCCRGGRILRIIEKATRRTVEEYRVVLFQVRI